MPHSEFGTALHTTWVSSVCTTSHLSIKTMHILSKQPRRCHAFVWPTTLRWKAALIDRKIFQCWEFLLLLFWNRKNCSNISVQMVSFCCPPCVKLISFPCLVVSSLFYFGSCSVCRVEINFLPALCHLSSVVFPTCFLCPHYLLYVLSQSSVVLCCVVPTVVRLPTLCKV